MAQISDRIESILKVDAEWHCSSVLGQRVFSEFSSEKIRSDGLNSLKELLKNWIPSLYPTLIQIFSPVFGTNPIPAFLKQFDLSSDFVANLGAGVTTYKGVISVDGAGYPSVDVVCDLGSLPFCDEALDGVISVAVLEHVQNPVQHVAEMYRVLKPGGRLLVFIPFLQPFHASPEDYQRYTRSGLLELFSSFKNRQTSVAGGPTSTLLWVFQEWCAVFLSFGSPALYRIFSVTLLLLSPLKVIDILFWRNPLSEILASGFLLTAEKR